MFHTHRTYLNHDAFNDALNALFYYDRVINILFLVHTWSEPTELSRGIVRDRLVDILAPRPRTRVTLRQATENLSGV